MISFIEPEELLSVRNMVLREGKLPLNECRFPTDKVEGAFHLGYYIGGQLVSIVSLHPQTFGDFIGTGYQLRGMATLEQHQGKGLGNRLLNFAIVYLRGQKANYIWCNARKKALRFYQDGGFEIVSAEFEIKGIGPHHVMYLKIM
jgi:GNAT superfamily N-acetyltransferase